MFFKTIALQHELTTALFAKLRKRKESEKKYASFYIFYAPIIRLLLFTRVSFIEK